MQRIIIAALHVYKDWISPLLPSACRYYPTCSEYMSEAVERFGAVRGMWMGLRRLGRCHPFHEGGFDPVPDSAGASCGRRETQENVNARIVQHG